MLFFSSIDLREMFLRATFASLLEDYLIYLP